MAILGTSLGVAVVASLAFLGWALSVEHDSQRGETIATADPSVTVRVEPTRRNEHELTGAFILGPDGASQSGWTFDEGILDVMDDAAGDCLPSGEQRAGALVRVIAWTEGPADPRLRIVALEVQPPSSSRPARFYAFDGRDGRHVFDETGARSCGIGWQPPLTQLRRTSRFNPKRMHPILHRVVPHQGTDFGAPKGTPVYASYRGVVDWVGPHGGHGNWVSVIHPDGVETGYAHLSRFARGLKHGDRVRAHQLIGYVGSTGRSTGPHLHWSARKDGEWFDAETLLAKAGHGVPDADRAAFLAVKAELDRRLDKIPLPAR